MKRSGINQELLHVLVSLYNQSIQTYSYFPEVILCGRQRIEQECFQTLLHAELIEVYKGDSFGKYYRLSKKGEQFLLTFSFRRRHKQVAVMMPTIQPAFPFHEVYVHNC